MNNSFPRLIDGMCATLRNEVLSRIDDDYARGQVFGVINLLNTFKARADWSVVFLAQQVQVQCDALNAVRHLLASVDAAPALSERQAPVPITTAELEVLRDACNRDIGLLLKWVSEQRSRVSPDIAQAVEDQLRQSMRKEIEIELKNSPRPIFAEMSSGKES